MNGDPFQRVTPGTPLRIPAQVWNELLGVAEDARGGVEGSRPIEDDPTSVVIVKNSSGSDVKRFDALGIEGPLLTPPADVDPAVPAELIARNKFAASGYVLDGGSTLAANHAIKFAVCVEAIENGKLGRAIVSGLALARVKMDADSNEAFATVQDADPRLITSPDTGAPIIWIEPGLSPDDEGWALLNLNPGVSRPVPDRLFARITGSTSLGNNRWSYNWEEVTHTGEGYTDSGAADHPQWSTTGETHITIGLGYNLAEDPNTGVGVEGIGIDVDGDAADGFSIQPVAAGRIVSADVLTVPKLGGDPDETTTEIWFSVTNGFDGDCP